MIYLDSAAVVKLVHAEAESAALRDWLDERAETGWISSVLTEIESFRALARYAPDAASGLPAVLDLIDLIPLDPPIQASCAAQRSVGDRNSRSFARTARGSSAAPAILRQRRQ